MAHLTLQLGASFVVPCTALWRRRGAGRNWRLRGMQEAGSLVADRERFGWASLQVAGRRLAHMLSEAAARECRPEA